MVGTAHDNELGESDEQAVATYLDAFNGDFHKAVAALYVHERATPLSIKKPRAHSDTIAVSVRNLEKDYKLGKQKIQALRGVSCDIYEGEFVALTGTSGSGKSTLLQLIGGLDRPTRGEVSINGTDISKLKDAKLSQFRNTTIGFVFQFFYLQPFLRLVQNIDVPGMFLHESRATRQQRVNELAEAVGLADRLNHLPKELSGGQMQRAAIARALLNQPKILLADEPTGNLDSTNTAAIIKLFDDIRERYGTTIIMVTHDQMLARHADREIILKDGAIV